MYRFEVFHSRFHVACCTQNKKFANLVTLYIHNRLYQLGVYNGWNLVWNYRLCMCQDVIVWPDTKFHIFCLLVEQNTFSLFLLYNWRLPRNNSVFDIALTCHCKELWMEISAFEEYLSHCTTNWLLFRSFNRHKKLSSLIFSCEKFETFNFV